MTAYDRARVRDVQNVGDGERAVSTVLGAALLINGVLRPSLWHTLLAFGGAALVQRGLTGRCNLYRSLGIDTATRDRVPQHRLDRVERDSDDSFPASDPPSWTPVAGARAH
jgi:uncharacterized membrane protein